LQGGDAHGGGGGGLQMADAGGFGRQLVGAGQHELGEAALAGPAAVGQEAEDLGAQGQRGDAGAQGVHHA
jgi:hypothetical protein